MVTDLKTNRIKVFHIDTELYWRGGQNQILEFLKLNQSSNKILNYVASPFGSLPLQRYSFFSSVFPIRKMFLINIVKMNSFVKKESVNTVVAHSGKAHMYGLILKILNPKVKLVVLRKINKKLKKSILRSWKYKTHLVDSFIAISKSVADSLIEVGVEKHKIKVVTDIISPKEKNESQLLTLKEKLIGYDKNKIVITNIAFLDKQKNQEALLKALCLVKKKHLNFICYIAGTGPLEDKLKNLISELKLSAHVKLLGFIDETTELLSLSNVFVFPSIDEGLGSSLIDAVYQDCILVGANSGGIKEIIEHGKTGLVFDPSSPKDLGDQLLFLFKNFSVGDTYKKKARLHIAEKFNYIKENDKLVQIFASHK